MVDYTNEMQTYDKVCAKLTAANIQFEEIEVDNFKVTFKLTKDGFSSLIIIDCASPDAEKQAEYGIACIDKIASWNENRKEK